MSSGPPQSGSARSPSAPLSPTGITSAVYEGVVRHRRHSPHPHAFRYKLAQLFLDLDEIDTVFREKWLWSRDRRNLAEFRRSDYFGAADKPLTDCVRDTVEQQTGHRPRGPIKLLTHLRYAGFSFNPVSFYYCYSQDSTTLECILAEITNTPWHERHAYVLPARSAQRVNRALHWEFAKEFHVSPFMAMDRQYEWTFSEPADHLRVHMNVVGPNGPEFDATLVLKRRQLDAAALRRVLWRYPLMTAKVVGAIHWQALRLWLKGNPVYDHPSNQRVRT
jgi:uncharacterized protein